MDTELLKLVDESRKLELYVSDIYMIFYKAFPEDSVFWWKLVLEEKHHAALIKSIENADLSSYFFSEDILESLVQVLFRTNNKLISLINEYNQNPPSRESAFNMAIELEKSAGEYHFQLVMEKSSETTAMKIFHELNADNKNHLKKIQAYMVNNGIEVDISKKN
ncbi:MAG: hypothetical protein MRK01_15720 [Candidatus Scalindua sp.]|nr:hypothetical protein [Candidatus Scalindua sp.]